MATWTHVQGNFGRANTGSPLTITLGANPTQGNVVVVCFILGSVTIGTLTVQDSNSNVYNLVAGPTQLDVGGGDLIYYFVLFSAPSNATSAITATWSPTGPSAGMWVDEFTLDIGLAAFDTSSAVDFAGTSGATVQQPSVAPATQNELFYAVCLPNGLIIAPAVGVTQGVWVGTGIDGVSGNAAEYSLNVSSQTPPNFTDSLNPDVFGVVLLALKSTASASSYNISMLAR